MGAVGVGSGSGGVDTVGGRVVASATLDAQAEASAVPVVFLKILCRRPA